MAVRVNGYMVLLLVAILFNLLIISDAGNSKSKGKDPKAQSNVDISKTSQNITIGYAGLTTDEGITPVINVEEMKETTKSIAAQEDKELTVEPVVQKEKEASKKDDDQKILKGDDQKTKKEEDEKTSKKEESQKTPKKEEDQKTPKKEDNAEDKETEIEDSAVKVESVESPKQDSETVIEKPNVVVPPKSKGTPKPLVHKLPDDREEDDPYSYQTKNSSHTFQTLFIFFLFVIGCYFCFHSRNKILGMIVEGRGGRRGRRSVGGVRYRPLNTDESAIESGIY